MKNEILTEFCRPVQKWTISYKVWSHTLGSWKKLSNICLLGKLKCGLSLLSPSYQRWGILDIWGGYPMTMLTLLPLCCIIVYFCLHQLCQSCLQSDINCLVRCRCGRKSCLSHLLANVCYWICQCDNNSTRKNGIFEGCDLGGGVSGSH